MHRARRIRVSVSQYDSMSGYQCVSVRVSQYASVSVRVCRGKIGTNKNKGDKYRLIDMEES